jgi:RNA polymerase sigma factor (TIGR02999 family)
MREGDTSAEAQLLPLVYDELHILAQVLFRNQRADQTLQPTALVHEAYLKLIDQDAVAFDGRAHFFRVAARAMRQILIDHARARNAAKRGGGWERVTIEQPGAAALPLDVLALDEAVTQLSQVDQRQADVVEMRFFAGLTIEETAQALGVSERTIDLDWKMAKAWLSRALSSGETT